jgi:hypothetical protein
MTDVSVGPLSAEEARVQSAADEAYSVLEGDEPVPADATTRLLDALRARTREAPLQALAVAFLLGVMLRRRR